MKMRGDRVFVVRSAVLTRAPSQYWDDDYDWENYDSADDDAPHCPVSAVPSRRSPRDVADASSYRLARPRRHVAFIKSTPNPKSRANLDDVKGVGGVFMMLLEGIVVGVGALMCAIGSWFAHKFYKGEKLPFVRRRVLFNIRSRLTRLFSAGTTGATQCRRGGRDALGRQGERADHARRRLHGQGLTRLPFPFPARGPGALPPGVTDLISNCRLLVIRAGIKL